MRRQKKIIETWLLLPKGVGVTFQSNCKKILLEIRVRFNAIRKNMHEINGRVNIIITN